MARYDLERCVLEVGAPVEVDRRAGHFWFSCLYPVEGDEILCAATTADDKAQGEWPALLYRSRDGGASWKGVADIRYGPTATPIGSGRVFMMPYELWPLKPGDKRNAKADGAIISCAEDGTVSTERTPVEFLGFPRDIPIYNEDELTVHTNGNILPLRDGRLFMTTYGRFEGEEKYDVFAVASEDGGHTWRFLSVVGRWQDVPDANEGPDESNTTRLADGRLMCVYRTGGGQKFYKSYSADEGATWTKAEPVEDAWSVEPQLRRLDGGLILLSGGRQGLFFWVCADGEGRAWERFNLAEHHNATVADATMHYPDEILRADASQPAQSTSYTCMAHVAPNELLISYDRLGDGWSGAPGPWGKKDAVFCVRVKAEPK